MSELEENDFDFLNQNTPKQESDINKVKIIIAALILLLLIGGAIYYFAKSDEEGANPEQQEINEAGSQEGEEQDATDMDSDVENSTAGDETTSETEEEQTVTEMEDTTGETGDEAGQTESVEPETDLIYFIVSGAFKEENNAQRKVDELKSAGYNAVIVGQNANGLFIVAYEGFPDIQSAKDKLAEIKNENQSAWIYKKVD